MESNSDHAFKTLDLISLFSPDRPINEITSDTQSNENNNTVSKKTSKKRKKNDDDSSTTGQTTSKQTRTKEEKQKEIVISNTIEMSTTLKDRITELSGFDIKTVTQKKLQYTDMNKNHGRLLIPYRKLMNEFASEEERKILRKHSKKDEKNRIGFRVLIIDPLLRNRHIELKMWKVGNHDLYCLTSEWNSLVQQNSLEAGDYIQLWSFRSNNNHAFIANHQNPVDLTSNLCFALVKLDISEGIFKFI